MIQETQLNTDGNGNEIQNVNVTISVPVKDIAGLVAINYEELASKVYNNLDFSSIASDAVDEIDSDDLIEKIDMDDLVRNFKDQIDISDYIDTNEHLFTRTAFTGNWIIDDENSCYLKSLLPINLGTGTQFYLHVHHANLNIADNR